MRIAVVGTGSFGRRRGASFARLGHEVAFVSRERARALAATASVGGEARRACERVEDALGWADAAFVATPPALHGAPVRAFAGAGKPVLVEKPACATLVDARSLREGLGDAAALVTVAENYRFLPALGALERARDELGHVESVRVVLRRPRVPRDWRVVASLAGGGVLSDVGVHLVHLVRLLFGAIRVEAAREGPRSEGGVELELALEGRTEGGARVGLDLAWGSATRRSLFRLEGARGSATHRVGRPFVFRRTRLGLPRLPLFAGLRDRMGQQATDRDWLAAAARGGRGAVSLDLAIADLEVVDAAYALARRG